MRVFLFWLIGRNFENKCYFLSFSKILDFLMFFQIFFIVEKNSHHDVMVFWVNCDGDCNHDFHPCAYVPGNWFSLLCLLDFWNEILLPWFLFHLSLGRRRAQFFISLLQRYSWEHEDKVANLWWIMRSNASPSKHLKGWAWKSYPPKITKRRKPNPENFLSHFYPPITSTCCRERVGSQNCPTLYNLVWVHTSLWSTLVIIGRLIKNLGLCFRE